MRENRKVRLIRKRDRETNTEASAVNHSSPRAPSEREIKSVVSRWVRDHRRQTEEFRRNFAALLRAGEVLPTR